jgi:hypothetical protein
MKGAADRGGVQVGRRARQSTPRSHLVKFFLTDEELEKLSVVASHEGLARGAFAAESALAAARGSAMPNSSPLRDSLVELMRAPGLVRRMGINLNRRVRTAADRARLDFPYGSRKLQVASLPSLELWPDWPSRLA